MLRAWFVNTIAVFALAYLLPGVHIDNIIAGAVAALVLGLLNSLLRPILLILTLPLSVLTLGLFVLVVNTLIVMLADFFVAGFVVDSFMWALFFSLGMSVIVSIVGGKKND